MCGRLAAFGLAGGLLEEQAACVGAMILQPASCATGTGATEAGIGVEAGDKDTTAEDMGTRASVHGTEDDGSLRMGCEEQENESAEVCDNDSRSASCLDG